tara:strand:+ start:492 stop:977 length:486 start_codon:yes stop_codon:yes gene_type:complete
MAKSKEQSAIDAIYALVERVDLLDKKIEIVDTNIKHLNNKVSQLLTSSNSISAPSAAPASIPSATAGALPRGSENIDKLVLGPVKVFGRIVDKNMVPIPDVNVSVYDSSSDLIKSERSSSDGYWEVRLPSGKYGVEYSHSRFKTVNRTIELQNGIKIFEVK